MNLQQALESQDLLESVVKKIPVLHGKSLLVDFTWLKHGLSKAFEPQIAEQLFTYHAGYDFLKDKTAPYDIARIFLTIEPKLYKSNTFAHLINRSRENYSENPHNDYMMALYYFTAMKAGELTEPQESQILEHLEKALMTIEPHDQDSVNKILPIDQSLCVCRCYALMGDYYFEKQDRKQAAGAYWLALSTQHTSTIDKNREESEKWMYFEGMSQRYAGDHNEAFAAMNTIITNIWFEELYAINPDEDFEDIDIIDSVAHNLQAIMICLDCETANLEIIDEELFKIRKLIDKFDLPETLSNLYYFCLGRYYALSPEESWHEFALDCFQHIPVYPETGLTKEIWEHINYYLQTREMKVVPWSKKTDSLPPTSNTNNSEGKIVHIHNYKKNNK